MIAKDILVPIDTEERKILRKSKFAQDLNLADPIDNRKGYWQAYQKESGYPRQITLKQMRPAKDLRHHAIYQ